MIHIHSNKTGFLSKHDLWEKKVFNYKSSRERVLLAEQKPFKSKVKVLSLSIGHSHYQKHMLFSKHANYL